MSSLRREAPTNIRLACGTRSGLPLRLRQSSAQDVEYQSMLLGSLRNAEAEPESQERGKKLMT